MLAEVSVEVLNPGPMALGRHTARARAISFRLKREKWVDERKTSYHIGNVVGLVHTLVAIGNGNCRKRDADLPGKYCWGDAAKSHCTMNANVTGRHGEALFSKFVICVSNNTNLGVKEMLAKQLGLFEEFGKTGTCPEPQTLSVGAGQAPYLHVAGDIPLDLPSGALLSIARKQPLSIYLLGFQPAKTIPEIPRWFLQAYASLPSTVLDPFSGSGTTIIEALRFGASVYWLDYHPLSRLICRVKTTTFAALEVLEESFDILRKSSRQKHAPETVHFANKDFWFQEPVQEGLEILREHILRSRAANQPVLWLALASTVRKTSNMNDGMLLAARRPHIEKIPKRSRDDVFRYFKMYLDKAIAAIAEWQSCVGDAPVRATELPLQDARALGGDWTCDAVVTSPPYINAIDYVWASKFELHWLGLVNNDEDRLNLYLREIGTERIPRSEYRELGQTGHEELDPLIEDIYRARWYRASGEQNQLRARVVYKYFTDMRKHFVSAYSKLRPGGFYCFSVGDVSRICGVEVPVASILSELACEVGFLEKFRFNLLLKNRKLNVPRNVNWAGTIKHDTTVVLEKPAK